MNREFALEMMRRRYFFPCFLSLNVVVNVVLVLLQTLVSFRLHVSLIYLLEVLFLVSDSRNKSDVVHYNLYIFLLSYLLNHLWGKRALERVHWIRLRKYPDGAQLVEILHTGAG